jgi:hypothetical protein
MWRSSTITGTGPNLGDYNFANLSPYDFELFIRDLLNASENLQLRAFSPGRDGGIDLRAWESSRSRNRVIVQCKHMMGSTFPNLRAKAEEEKEKLDRLEHKPSRYIFATTKPLTAANVDELFDILQPYCKSTVDILDTVSIEEMLARHPDVLRHHYKLWITSVPVLQRLLHAGIYNRSDAYLEDLLLKSRTFIQPNAFVKAQKILKENHVCIISGPPGVGKTTLADMLCLEHLASGFELIVVSEDVLEADSVYDENRKQVFIYDDFLGRTDLYEKLGKNEDNRIIQFIRRVNRSPKHRFVLTTREYILRAARIRYDRLDVEDINPLTLVLEISNYTELQRGLILYQHLFFSDGISQADIQDLVASRGYTAIVQHRNYTPRHISDALNQINRRSTRRKPSATLADKVLAVLDNPTHMWSHALKELSSDARRLFLTLVLLREPVSTDVLQVAYTSQIVNRSEPFIDSLRSLEGSFVRIDRTYFFSGRRVSFRNPSLQDFANRYVDENSDMLDVLLSAPCFYEQVISVFSLSMAKVKYPGIRRWVERRADKLIERAIDLLVTEKTKTVEGLAISQLLEVMTVYGAPANVKTLEKLCGGFREAINPLNLRSADITVGLLQKPAYKNILDRTLQEDSAEAMRYNVLSKGTWRFGILAKLDDVTGRKRSESWASWGNDFMDYVRQLAADRYRLQSYEDLRRAILEISLISKIFSVNLDREITILKKRQESFDGLGIDEHAPSEDSDDDSDADWSDEAQAWAYDREQLDRIFDSLL